MFLKGKQGKNEETDLLQLDLYMRMCLVTLFHEPDLDGWDLL